MGRSTTTAARPSTALAAAVATFDDERLAALLTARPDLADPVPADVAALAARAWGWQSIYRCYRRLDRWRAQVVQALCLLAPPVTVGRLTAFLGPEADAVDVEAAVDALGDLALLVRHGDRVELAPAFAELPYPAGLGPPAELLLASQTSGQLNAVARRLGVQPGRTKTATIKALTAALSSPDGMRRTLGAAPAASAHLARRLATEGPSAAIQGYYASVSDHIPAGWLLNRGLLVAVSWNTALMPGEVGLALRGGRPFDSLASRRPAMSPVEVGTDVVDAGAAEAALQLVADVTTILGDWSSHPPKLLKSGGLGVRELRKAAKAVGRDERETARVVDLAAGAGLVVVEASSESALPTAAYDDWLALEPARRWQALAESWLRSPFHLGLAGEKGSNQKPIPALLDRYAEPEAAERRRAVLSTLVTLAPGEAATAPQLEARMMWEAPTLWSGGPAPPTMLIEWVVAEAELIGLGHRRAIATAGRLAAGGRLDEAAAALAARAPKVSSTFVVQADLTVVAPGELATDVRDELELLADVESKGAATVYRIGEASLRRGFDAGRTAGQVEAFLTEHAEKAVPQSLSYLIADIGRRFGQVRVGTARCYVRSDDPSLLAEIVRARRTAGLGLRLLAPTVAVADADPDDALAGLRAAGYLPAAEDAGGGLVVVRPQRRRAPAHPDAGPWALGGLPVAELRRRAGLSPPGPAGPPPVAEIVARLRAAPAAKPASGRPAASTGRPAPVPRPAPPPLPAPHSSAPDLYEDLAQVFDELALFDEPARPVEIARGAADVMSLLSQAYVEDWPVRVGYTNRKGHKSQLNIVVVDDPADDVLVEHLPDGTSRTLVLDRIEWARIMTDAEEELLYR